MPLKQLYNLANVSLGASAAGLSPGGAGVQVAGTSINPGISAPRIEESDIEVLDVTAPSLIGSTTLSTPAPTGAVLVMSHRTGAFGSRWKQNTVQQARLARGSYGIVVTPGPTQTSTTGPTDAGYAVGTPVGNEAQYGTKATVRYDGPAQALVETTVGGIAISAGMPLEADGSGFLTAFSYGAGSNPAPGATLAKACDAVASSVSTPKLINVYIGGY